MTRPKENWNSLFIQPVSIAIVQEKFSEMNAYDFAAEPLLLRQKFRLINIPTDIKKICIFRLRLSIDLQQSMQGMGYSPKILSSLSLARIPYTNLSALDD